MKNIFKLLSIVILLTCSISYNNNDDSLVKEKQSQSSVAIARAFYQEVIISKNIEYKQSIS